MTEVDWLSEITRAALPQAVLSLLAVERQHGYAMIETLHHLGFTRIKGGTLYPLLRRLEEQGLVEHLWEHPDAGPGRKTFALTPLGKNELERARTSWALMNTTLTTLHAERRDT